MERSPLWFPFEKLTKDTVTVGTVVTTAPGQPVLDLIQ